jgi:mRNA interferase HigB
MGRRGFATEKRSDLDSFAFCEFNEFEGTLHVISRKKLLEAAARCGDLSVSLDAWYRIVKQAFWKDIVELRRQFPSADAVGRYTVFNTKGNAYRLIGEIYYKSQVVLIRAVLSHAEYDKEGWKR